MKTRRPNLLIFAALTRAVLFSVLVFAPPAGAAEHPTTISIQAAINAVIPTLLAKDRIPGMAVAVTDGHNTVILNYGVASRNPRSPVTNDTLFEIGSVTKAFTATLASWAQTQQRLSFADPVAKYLPEFRAMPFGSLRLLHLGTHTPGGLPLQFPDGVKNDALLTRYFQKWRPAYPAGTFRTYSNLGIGMLGVVAAKSMRDDFRSLVQQRLFPVLGLRQSFFRIPASKVADYAWGFTDDDKPIRMTNGMLSDETYGVKSTAADMIRFIQDNIDPTLVPSPMRKAVTQTHTGFFRAGMMTQDLIWEQYPYPVALPSLLAGNSYKMLLQPTRVMAINPPQRPMQNVWLDKTGSTNGFGTYVAFVPSKQLGIVLLANKNYPIADRVTAAYRILSALKK